MLSARSAGFYRGERERSAVLEDALPRKGHAAREPEFGFAAARRSFDRSVIFIVGVLMTIGTVMVYSASVTLKGAELDFQNWWQTPLKQCAFALAGFVSMLVFAAVDYRVFAWRRRWDGWRAGVLILLAVGLQLAAIALPNAGSSRVAGQRSLAIAGPVSVAFQPAELGKVALVVWTAALLAWRGRDVGRFRTGFLPAIVAPGVLILLTGKADFGTAALMGAVTLLLLVLGGARWLHLGLLVVLGAAAGAVLVIAEPYRVERLLTFFSAAPDESAEAYQITQALIAIGSGGWFGRGLGAGVQKHGYLPQQNNDFILATICEELGAAGGLLIVGLFVLLLWRGWVIATRSGDPFGRLLAAGCVLMICLQAAFNVAVVTDSVPTKGISLPFVSAGGSGVIFLGMGAGLLASVGRTRRASPH